MKKIFCILVIAALAAQICARPDDKDKPAADDAEDGDKKKATDAEKKDKDKTKKDVDAAKGDINKALKDDSGSDKSDDGSDEGDDGNNCDDVTTEIPKHPASETKPKSHHKKHKKDFVATVATEMQTMTDYGFGFFEGF